MCVCVCVCVQGKDKEGAVVSGTRFGHSCLLSLTSPQQWHGRVVRATITVIITVLQLTVDRVAVCNGLLFDCEKGLHLHIVPGSESKCGVRAWGADWAGATPSAHAPHTLGGGAGGQSSSADRTGFPNSCRTTCRLTGLHLLRPSRDSWGHKTPRAQENDRDLLLPVTSLSQ